MRNVKLVRPVALLILALVCGTAQAQYQVSGNGRLEPVPGCDEPSASGSATFRGSVGLGASWIGSGYYDAYFGGVLTVSCRGLTPFAVYRINESTSFTADSRGRAAVRVDPFYAFGLGWGTRNVNASFDVTVARQVIQPDGTTAYDDVLQGPINVRVW
jgi:hypothetical protein